MKLTTFNSDFFHGASLLYIARLVVLELHVLLQVTGSDYL